ncbi:MAG: amino acid ABC transporter ATP-binding protein [Acidobacteria bacterium]|nr:amino acid ABC transporter ATP-binding protein [Acidobacteriota bacterium]
MTPVLGVRGLELARGTRQILRGVDLGVHTGELVALMGLSGSGKTTVLRAIAGLETFGGGRIEVDGLVLDGSARHLGDLHRKVGMVFQFHCLWDHLTAVENICLAPVHVYGTPAGEATTRARGLLAELGVGHREQALPRELSGGEAQRVAIARALAADPRLLLMDEPTASLDPARRGELGHTLRQLTAKGRSLLLTCHDDDFVRDFATRVVVLADGRVVEEGDPAVVLTTPAHEATRRLLDMKGPVA